jgi:hypothetical protein
LSVTAGTNVTFSVTAAGTAPLSWLWRVNDTWIEAATNSSLTLTNVQVSQAGSYSVVVTNAAGSATSSNALLTVITNLVLVSATIPANQVGLIIPSVGSLTS